MAKEDRRRCHSRSRSRSRGPSPEPNDLDHQLLAAEIMQCRLALTKLYKRLLDQVQPISWNRKVIRNMATLHTVCRRLAAIESLMVDPEPIQGTGQTGLDEDRKSDSDSHSNEPMPMRQFVRRMTHHIDDQEIDTTENTHRSSGCDLSGRSDADMAWKSIGLPLEDSCTPHSNEAGHAVNALTGTIDLEDFNLNPVPEPHENDQDLDDPASIRTEQDPASESESVQLDLEDQTNPDSLVNPYQPFAWPWCELRH